MPPLEGKVAIVTGAAGGQGRAEAAAFAAAGAIVVATDITENLASRFAGMAGAITCLKHDVTSEEDWARIIRTCLERWGRVDVPASIARHRSGIPTPPSTIFILPSMRAPFSWGCAR